MNKFYRIAIHANVYGSAIARHRAAYSIEETGSLGQFIAQAAFWFRSKSEAEARLKGIIAEDASEGTDSTEITDGQWHANSDAIKTEWARNRKPNRAARRAAALTK